jgi:hypothetical protein
VEARLLREAFDGLLAVLRGLGPVRVDAVKRGINLARGSHFAMVFVRKGWLAEAYGDH